MLVFTFPIALMAHRMSLVKVATRTKKIPFQVSVTNLR